MQEKKARYYWVDVLKVLGIFLVYYAHILQRAYRLSTDGVFEQFKLIYAFHIPLFFFSAGFFYKNPQHPNLVAIVLFFQKRIFPVLLFTLISLLLWFPYLYLKFGAIDFQFIWDSLLFTLQGQPELNQPLWFLVCLFSVEVLAVLVLPKIKTMMQGILLSSAFLYLGYFITAAPKKYFLLPKNFWYIHEALVAFGFFILGYATFRWLNKLVQINPVYRIGLMLLLGWVTFWSANLNAPFEEFAVIMKISMHGNGYFFLSAFAGIGMMVLVASLIPEMKWLDYFGRNTLILLGTNGLFMSFFNSHVMDWVGHYDSTLWVTVESLLLSILTMLMSVPVINILNKWLPQLVGKPQAEGPLLKAFPLANTRAFEKKWKRFLDAFGTIRE